MRTSGGDFLARFFEGNQGAGLGGNGDVNLEVLPVLLLLLALLAVFFFLVLELDHFLLAHLVVLTGSKHRAAALVSRGTGAVAAPGGW